MTTAQPAVMAATTLSPYRYTLHRGWGPGRRCCWIMLNPSTATDTTDDPTLRRCIRFSTGWGFGQLIVVNLFALRATKPAALATHADPIGPDSDTTILVAAHHADQVICAWGAHQWATPRARTVTNLLHGTPLSCLGTTQHGHPHHPLYIIPVGAEAPLLHRIKASTAPDPVPGGRTMTTPASTHAHSMVPVRIFGTSAQLTVAINDAEKDRRTRAGLGALPDLAALEGLLNLPLGWPVDIVDLTDTERRLVDRLPDSAVEHRALIDATVIRRVQPVLRVLDATVRARIWRAGLARVSRFAPYCTRSLVLLGDLSDEERDAACWECCYHGVGLATTTHGMTPLVAPEPFLRTNQRHTAQNWWFTEEVYRQLSTRTGV